MTRRGFRVVQDPDPVPSEGIGTEDSLTVRLRGVSGAEVEGVVVLRVTRVKFKKMRLPGWPNEMMSKTLREVACDAPRC